MKELIYLDENALSPAGGPLGVGYYINEEAKKAGDDCIEFIKSNPKVKEKEGKQKKILYKFPRLTKIVRSVRHIKDYRNMLYSPSVEMNKFDDYDVVHFHTTSDMYKQRKNLENYKGVVLLTSHSPIPLAQELYAACATGFERHFFKKRIKEFENMDKWSFMNADYVVFPCPDAEEPYYNNWKDYSDIKEARKDHFKYVLTGISQREAKVSKSEIRKKYNITNDEFVIVYVGRHNEVTGYGKLKELGKNILEKNRDIKFLIAGREGPLTRLENPSWIEIGFTKDPYSLISAGDVFVLPNNETYFDLVMIEVLSLGKIVIASRTGGNKYYEKAGAKGVFLYDTLAEAEELVDKVKAMSKEERKKLEKENRCFYEKHLTSTVFYENYKKMVNEVVD